MESKCNDLFLAGETPLEEETPSDSSNASRKTAERRRSRGIQKGKLLTKMYDFLKVGVSLHDAEKKEQKSQLMLLKLQPTCHLCGTTLSAGRHYRLPDSAVTPTHSIHFRDSECYCEYCAEKLPPETRGKLESREGGNLSNGGNSGNSPNEKGNSPNEGNSGNSGNSGNTQPEKGNSPPEGNQGNSGNVEIPSKLFRSRQGFLNICQENHLHFHEVDLGGSFDVASPRAVQFRGYSLPRPARRRSAQRLLLQRGRTAGRVSPQCGSLIFAGNRFHCATCRNFNLCGDCNLWFRHPHPLLPVAVDSNCPLKGETGNLELASAGMSKMESDGEVCGNEGERSAVHIVESAEMEGKGRNHGEWSDLDDMLMHVFSCHRSGCKRSNCSQLKKQILHALTCCVESGRLRGIVSRLRAVRRSGAIAGNSLGELLKEGLYCPFCFAVGAKSMKDRNNDYFWLFLFVA